MCGIMRLIILLSFFNLVYQTTIPINQLKHMEKVIKSKIHKFKGVTYTFNKTINTFLKNEELIYGFDISILREATENPVGGISSYCKNESTRYNDLLNKKLKDILAMEYVMDSDVRFNKIIFTDTFSALNELKTDIHKFQNSTNTEKCIMFKKMASNFQKVYFYIEKFNTADFSFINEIIKFEQFRHDILQAISKYYFRNISIPLDLEGGYDEEFFASTRIKVQFHNEILYLKINVPIFEKNELFDIKLTPFIIESKIYTLRKEADFVAFNDTNPIPFSTQDIENLCYLFKNELFCQNNQEKYICNRKYLTFKNIEKPDNICFESVIISPEDKYCLNIVRFITFFLGTLMIIGTIYFMKKIIELKLKLNSYNTYTRESSV